MADQEKGAGQPGEWLNWGPSWGKAANDLKAVPLLAQVAASSRYKAAEKLALSEIKKEWRPEWKAAELEEPAVSTPPWASGK